MRRRTPRRAADCRLDAPQVGRRRGEASCEPSYVSARRPGIGNWTKKNLHRKVEMRPAPRRQMSLEVFRSRVDRVLHLRVVVGVGCGLLVFASMPLMFLVRLLHVLFHAASGFCLQPGLRGVDAKRSRPYFPSRIAQSPRASQKPSYQHPFVRTKRPSGTKVPSLIGHFAARLKPCPFKTGL